MLSPTCTEAALRISCPFCGDRTHAEFTYLGDAGNRGPTPTGIEHDATLFVDYVYRRANPAGWHKEGWQLSGGGRAWLVVERNVTTHEIGKTFSARAIAEGAVP